MSHTGGDALVGGLIRNGVTDLFMIPGIQLDWAVDALRRRAEEIRLFVPRHEQTTTYMADGYYRASGRVGTAMVVPGPGALNAGAGLATAYASNSGVVFLTGNIHSSGVGRGCGLLHEIKDQSGLVQGLTKWSRSIDGPGSIATAVDEAYSQVLSGRHRPVGLEVSHDFLSAQAPSFDKSSPVRGPTAAAQPEESDLARAAEAIDRARFPVLYVGGGIVPSGAEAALKAFAERLGAAVVMSDNGRGAIDDRHPLAMNALAGRAVFQHADLVVVVGSRFIDALVPKTSWPTPGMRYVHINVDADDMGSPRTPEVAVRADARAALEALAPRVKQRVVLSQKDALKVKAWAQQQVDQVSPQADYLRELRAALPEDGIFVNELTQIGYLGRIAFPVYSPRTYIGPGYQGTLGYGFPTALGAAVACPDKRILSVTGDGGFGWNLQELATAKRYQLPVTLIVFNDGHYGNVRAIQKREFGHEVAVELQNPDFQLLGRAFGIDTVQVDNPAALGAAVRDSISARGPVMIEVKVGVMPSPWHLLRLQPMAGMTGPSAPPNPLGEAVA